VRVLRREPELVAKLHRQTEQFRARLREIGFKPLDGEAAIVPIIVGETAFAIEFSRRLLDEGVFVTGFGYPVVPEGTARVRVQIMAEESRLMAAQAQAGQPVALMPGETKPQAAPTAVVVAQSLAPPPGVAASAPPPAKVKPRPTVAAPTQVAMAPIVPDGRVTQVPVRATNLYIQAGAFTNQSNAVRLQAKLASIGTTNITPIRVDGQRFFRVRLGPIATVDQADAMLDRVVGSGVPQARIVVD